LNHHNPGYITATKLSNSNTRASRSATNIESKFRRSIWYIDKAVMEMEPEQGGPHPQLIPHGSKYMLLYNGVHAGARVIVEITF
jgi:hypothetical protein